MLKKYFINFFALYVLLISSASAQLLQKRFSYKGTAVGYMISLPDDYDSNKNVYPTILFFHGVGEMGNGTTDLYKVALNGLPNLIQNNTFPKSFSVGGKTYKFIVICPQLNGAVPWQEWLEMESALIKHCKETYRIDNSRFYLTGLSQGGGIAWQYAGTSKENADQFAAMAPVCGAMDMYWDQMPKNIAASKLPVWAFHGTDDNVVSVTKSQDWVNSINKFAGYPLAKLTTYPNTDHGSWGKAYDLKYNQTNGFSDKNLYEWLLTNQRGPTPANAQYNASSVIVSQPSIPPSSVVATPAPVIVKSQTANDVVKSYSADYMYGVNMGYYGNAWQDIDLATLVKNAGGNTLRPSLPEKFLKKWGYDVRLNTFKDYAEKLQMKELTAFVGDPSDDVRDKTKYGSCDKESKVFANIYEPIWKADGTVNEKNYYAGYIFKTVQKYGQYVKFWEVWNEPDFTNADPAAWLTRDPYPCELTNLNAPVQHYIRMLRITYEIVKKYDPDDYVTTGGFGYTSFLDVVMRNTDNPDNGKVTSEYPNKGGAYFDVLSYHCYPYYYLRTWNNSINNFSFNRNSDAATNQLFIEKSKYETILKKYGYGSTYPSKYFIVTESNVSRKNFNWYSTSDEMQRNFNMKAVVQSQKNDIKQLYLFVVGESADYNTAKSEYDLMGMYENLNVAKPGTEKITQSGIGHKTIAQTLYTSHYDADLTAQLKMSDAVDGAVFTKGSEKYYVLWAKTKTDQSENATASFTFPDALKVKTLKKYAWNYSSTKKTSDVAGKTVSITGTPVIFTISSTEDVIANNPNPPVTVTPPVVTPPVTVTPPVVTPPVTVTPPVVTPPVTVTPPVVTPPVTVTPPVVIPPVTVTPPVVTPPVTVTPPLVVTPPVTVTPPVVTPPVTVTPPVVTPPVTVTPPVVIPPVTVTPPVVTPPVTVTPPLVVTPPVTVTPPVVTPPVTVSPPVVVKPPVTVTPPVVLTPPVTVSPPVVVKPPVTITPPVITTPVVIKPTLPIAITKPIEKESAKIFPNPVNTQANFSITNQETGKGTISIYNMRGLKVQEVAFSKTDATKTLSVQAANFRTGMYIIVIKVNAKTTVLKLMKI